MLKISYTELCAQPVWWVEDMVDIITTENEVQAKEQKMQQAKSKTSAARRHVR